jgi:spore cortex biosynthesis protein YabQ
MVIPLSLQAKFVIYSILAGVLTGFLFDFYRVFRGFERIHKVFIIIEDILFWILVSIIVFVFLLYTNQALITGYVYAFITLGIIFYLKFISKYFTWVHYRIIKNVSKVLRITCNFIFYPIKLLFYSETSKNKASFNRNDLNKS